MKKTLFAALGLAVALAFSVPMVGSADAATMVKHHHHHVVHHHHVKHHRHHVKHHHHAVRHHHKHIAKKG